LDITIEPGLELVESVQSSSDLSSIAQGVEALLEDEIKNNPVAWRGLDVSVNVNVS
jgi:hypothetical protein